MAQSMEAPEYIKAGEMSGRAVSSRKSHREHI